MKKSIVGIFAFGLLGLVSFGCGGGVANAPSNISGKVTYKGAPVTGGNIGFAAVDGMGAGSANIRPDGTYSTTNVPAGDMIVTVETESINPNIKPTEYKGGNSKMPGGGGGPAPGSKRQMVSSPKPSYAAKSEAVYVKIPAKYAKKNTSTLKTTLKPGNNTVDFDLVD